MGANQHSNKHVVSTPSQPDAASHALVNEQPIQNPIPTTVSADVTATSVNQNVVTIHTSPEPDTTVQKPEEPKLTVAEKARIRSERKRSREKQRRSDVNTQFSDLTTLLKKIEAEDVQGDEIRKDFITELSTASSNNMNRVDLIGKTITVLNRIHNDNQKRKRSIDELNEELKVTKKRADEATSKLQQQQSNPSGDKKSDNVMMMVPMMIRPDGTTQAPFMPQSMPYYPMCQQNSSDNSSGAMPANFAAMFNPFMFGKQFSGSQQPSSESKNEVSKESSGSSQQQFVPTMVPSPIGNDGAGLAHCA